MVDMDNNNTHFDDLGCEFLFSNDINDFHWTTQPQQLPQNQYSWDPEQLCVTDESPAADSFLSTNVDIYLDGSLSYGPSNLIGDVLQAADGALPDTTDFHIDVQVCYGAVGSTWVL
jgi:hypothetical protein